MQRQAHTLKGSGRDLGAKRLADLCEQIEERGRNGKLEGVEEMLERIEREFGAARTALERYLEERG